LLDPVVEMRTDHFELTVPASREAFAQRLSAIEGVGRQEAEQFLDKQRRVADALWDLFRDPDLLPPFGVRALLTHLKRVPQYLPILPIVGRSFAALLKKYGLDEGPVRDYFDAVCQITVQTGASQAEAPFALGATDYFFRGAGHIHGGIGNLAAALADCVEQMGGHVSYADSVLALEQEGDGWRVRARRGEWEVDQVVANVLPAALEELTGPSVELSGLAGLEDEVQSGWGAAMLYLGLDADADLPAEPTHLQLVGDGDRPCAEGNHVFCSIAGADETERAPEDQRTVTCSTHVDMDELLGADESEQAAYVERVQETMRETLRRRAPEIAEAVVKEMTASPRTFERFTGRPNGYVGGVPRRAGFHNYRRLTPVQPAPGLYLVGDSVFPGQSTLACAIGGVKVAGEVARRLQTPRVKDGSHHA
ncbi:MAG: phytoene desaturase family protein, partial [Bradymonadaceae bacterium]